jgi:hypothetical protein
MSTSRALSVVFAAVACLASFNVQAASSASSRLRSIFQRPVILGASVSSGFVTKSPGDRASERYTEPSNITNLAKSGSYGKDFQGVNAAWAKHFSVILAIDFMFWDSTLPDTRASVRNLKNLVASAARAGVPLVLGDIPELVNDQMSRASLNRTIYAVCKSSARCYIMKFDKLHEVATNEGLLINGRRYSYRDLSVDGVHPNAFAADYIAGMIVGLLSRDSALTAAVAAD